MQRIFFAPVLSATRSRDSCWITCYLLRRAGSPGAAGLSLTSSAPRRAPVPGRTDWLLGLLEDLDQAPALGRRERPGLHEQDAVADAGAVLLVVGLELGGAAHHLAVARVLLAVLDLD